MLFAILVESWTHVDNEVQSTLERKEEGRKEVIVTQSISNNIYNIIYIVIKKTTLKIRG